MTDPTPNPQKTIKISGVDALCYSFNLEGFCMQMKCEDEAIAQLKDAQETGEWVNISIASNGHVIEKTGKETIRSQTFIGRVINIQSKPDGNCRIDFQTFGTPTIKHIELG